MKEVRVTAVNIHQDIMTNHSTIYFQFHMFDIKMYLY